MAGLRLGLAEREVLKQKEQHESWWGRAKDAVDLVANLAEIAAAMARLPRKGTSERKTIEAARTRGLKAERAEEIENIRRGGKGSGVWTEEELEVIRKKQANSHLTSGGIINLLLPTVLSVPLIRARCTPSVAVIRRTCNRGILEIIRDLGLKNRRNSRR